MAVIPYVLAGFGSSALRIYENFYPVSKNTERYLKGEINFQQATDDIVKNIRIYLPLTTSKLICDSVVLCMAGQWFRDILYVIRSIFKDLINCGFQAFIDGIKLSLKHFFLALRDCSIALVVTQFKYLYQKPQQILSSMSIMDFCNISNQIYFLIIGKTNGLKQTIQYELVKYWLECMGIIRAIAEANNINFVKYMNQYCLQNNSDGNQLPNANENNLFELNTISWTRAKDPDFIRIIDVPLEDIFFGKTYPVTIRREIREIGQSEAKIEEETYTVIIKPGCPDGEEFRFTEAGDRDPVNIPADLVVRIQTQEHPLYKRDGANLIYTAKISLDDALNGTPIQVPSIDGNMKECNPRGTINPKTIVRIDHAGLPNPENNGLRGQLLVKFDIEFPETKLGAEPTE